MKFFDILLSLGAATSVLSAAVPVADVGGKVNITADIEIPAFVTDGGFILPGDIPKDISLAPKEGALFERDMKVECWRTDCYGFRFIHPAHLDETWHAFNRFYGGGFHIESWQNYCVQCRGAIIFYANRLGYSFDVTRNDFLRSWECIKPHILNGRSLCNNWSIERQSIYAMGWYVGAVQEFSSEYGKYCLQGC